MNHAQETLHEHFLQTGSFVTRLVTAGSETAPPLLLLHDGAWGGSAEVSWGHCIPRLAKSFRIIAPDFLGFGLSGKATYFDRAPYEARAQQLKDVLDILQITEPVHVVGTSFGGSVALRLAADPLFPLRSVTSVCGPGGIARKSTMSELSRWDGTRDDLARIVRFFLDDGDALERHLDMRLESASIPGHYRSVAAATLPVPELLKHKIEDDWPAQLNKATIPIYLIAGDRDQLMDADWTERIAAASECVDITTLPSTHCPNLNDPDLVMDVLEKKLGAS